MEQALLDQLIGAAPVPTTSVCADHRCGYDAPAMPTITALLAALSVALSVATPHSRDLREHLTEQEWQALIGREDTGVAYDVVLPVVPERRRRSTRASRRLLLDAPGLHRQFALDLTPAPALLDPGFTLVSRWGNRSEALPSGLVERDCYFTSEGESRAAVSLCGGVRGVIKPPGDEYYVINPLPKRFTKRSSDQSPYTPHIIVRKHISDFHTDHNTKRTSSPETADSFCGVRSESEPLVSPHRRHRGRRAVSAPVHVETAVFVDSDMFKHDSHSEPLVSPHRRHRGRRAVSAPVHVETAVFVDSDMFNLMSNNFPTDTEREVVRFVLALVNAVQLLYHDPSLGQPVTFVMKRLEILHSDPSGLVRYHDIDKFLGNFCGWQREENPVDDADPLHWDHALILTGLDLFVRSKNGKFSSQVVGLAPVAGMCTPTSSCTVNEGRHFESVYVVAHEIGHNLGMRHDGPLADNNCDPTSYLMSPTLGSGKITWSDCSRHYLLQFLRSPQSHCLMDHNDDSQLDHSSHGALPGERFDADQQCMLKYGAGSRHASSQPLHDLCRDLHCHRDRYTWTSHPALEGTACGTNKWCRSGQCVLRGLSQLQAGAMAGAVTGQWGPWGPYSECASGCLQGEAGGLGQGSTGIMFAYRQCNSPRPEKGGRGCIGSDRKYRTCLTNQCENIPKTTVRDFADEVCLRARDVDSELVGTGLQKISSDAEEACTVWCYKRNGGSKSRGWTFPDGTACRTHPGKQAMYCISGVCQEFSCERGGEDSHMVLSSEMCQVSRGKRREVAVGVWQPISDCYYNCVSPGSGVRLVERRSCHHCNSTASIQLCKQDTMVCGKVKSTLEYATVICTQYSERVRRLSGMGMQLSPVVEDPDRACRIACQDETVLHRFYLVNGEDGWFPFGTDCTKGDTTKKAFCIRGKCLEFGSDDTPLHESEYILPSTARVAGRHRRSFDHSVTITATLDNQTLAEMVQYINRTAGQGAGVVVNRTEVLDFNNPVVADISDWLKLNDVDSSYTL